MRWPAVLPALVAVGCGSKSLATEHVSVGSLDLEVPAAWDRVEINQRGITSAQWMPPRNTRKESITVTHTARAPLTAAAGAAAIEPLLVEAQRALDKARISAVTTVTTRSGFVGARLAVDFVPPGLRETYRRVHVAAAAE